MGTDSRQSLRHRQPDIEFFDCTTRFLVRSQSRPEEVHLVDLNSEDRGRYECSCEDWLFRNPDWIQNSIPYECKHITFAKTYLFNLAKELEKKSGTQESKES